MGCPFAAMALALALVLWPPYSDTKPDAARNGMATKARKARGARTGEDIDPAILENQLEVGRQSFMSLYKVTKQLQRENKKLRTENARFRSRIAKLTAR
jgi:hypothetical protein